MSHITSRLQKIQSICLQIAEACLITVCNCRKGYWHQQLDEASSFLTTFNTELGRFWYTVMPFGATVASDVSQRKLDECFDKLKQFIIIADDIMVDGYNPDHSDHNQPSLAHYRQPRSAISNYIMTNCSTSRIRSISLVRAIPQVVANQPEARCQLKQPCLHQPNKKQVQSFIGMINYLSDCQSLENWLENSQKTKNISTGDLNIRHPSQK